MKKFILMALAVLVLVPAAAVGFLAVKYRPRASREDPVAVAREIASLKAQRDSLVARGDTLVKNAELLQRIPSGDVLIGLPTPFVDQLVRDIITGWFHDVELHLKGLRVRKAGEVKAKMVVKKRTIGSYDLDLTLDDVRGKLQPGEPKLSFGGDIIRIALPLRVASGSGKATIKFVWDSKGMASPVCGELAATREVSGTVRRADYDVQGRMVLSAVSGALMADPDFPELAVRLFIDPSPESVKVLEDLLATKGGACGIAVGKAKVGDRVLGLVDKGFLVKIPQKFFRPLRLPIAVETSVPMQDNRMALKVTPSGLAVTSAAIWLGANVGVGAVAPKASK